MDSRKKQKLREIIKNEPLWGKGVDALAKVLFPKAITPEKGIPWFARYILYTLTREDKVIIRLPRRHAKSTFITFLYVMWCVLTRRKKFILIVSSTGNQAVKFLARIKHYLTSKKVKQYYGDLAASSAVIDTGNESFDYIDVKGKKRSQIWNYKEIYIEPWGIRIMATSISSANRGLLSVDDRPDLQIWDDVEDKKNTNTPVLRERIVETLYEELVPAGQIDCQFVAIGTICHYGSYLLKIDKAKQWKLVPIDKATMTFDEIEEINKQLPEEFRYTPKKEYFLKDTIGLDNKLHKKGEEAPEVAVWQEAYSYEYFADLRQEYIAISLEPSFWQEYYNRPKNKEQCVITEFQYIDDLRFKNLYGEQVLESNCSYLFPNGKRISNVRAFVGGDLAVSESTTSDYRAFITVFTDPWRNVYVFPPYRSKEPDPYIIAKNVLEWHNLYNYHSATFDGQHFQKWFGRIIKYLIDEERDENGKRRYKYLKVHQKARSENKIDVITGTLSHLFNAGKIYFVGRREQFKDLEKELVQLGYMDHDDLADALAYACSNLSYPDEVDFDMVGPFENKIRHRWYEDVPADRLWEFV